MSTAWQRAVEEGADVLAEMMVELADGAAEHTPEDLAAAVLASGIGRLASEPPSQSRVAAAAAQLFHALHGGTETDWAVADPVQRRFLEDTAARVLAAADPLLVPGAGAWKKKA